MPFQQFRDLVYSINKQNAQNFSRYISAHNYFVGTAPFIIMGGFIYYYGHVFYYYEVLLSLFCVFNIYNSVHSVNLIPI